MIYAEKHLSLLSRMERDGLQLRFTGEFPESITQFKRRGKMPGNRISL